MRGDMSPLVRRVRGIERKEGSVDQTSNCNDFKSIEGIPETHNLANAGYFELFSMNKFASCTTES